MVVTLWTILGARYVLGVVLNAAINNQCENKVRNLPPADRHAQINPLILSGGGSGLGRNAASARLLSLVLSKRP